MLEGLGFARFLLRVEGPASGLAGNFVGGVAAWDDRDLVCQDFEGDPGLGFAQPGCLLSGFSEGEFALSFNAMDVCVHE
ncbi:MAG TPA: hypothetical protein VLJ38_22785 [Polyangiaceae bacterium]|nr:hypothetical protein [Polyangiaceae bacterium]